MINSQQGQIWGWIMIIFCIDLVMFWFMQFVQTNMGEQMSRRIVDATGGYLKMEDIVNGTSFHTLFGIKCYTTCSFFLLWFMCHDYYASLQGSDELSNTSHIMLRWDVLNDRTKHKYLSKLDPFVSVCVYGLASGRGL